MRKEKNVREFAGGGGQTLKIVKLDVGSFRETKDTSNDLKAWIGGVNEGWFANDNDRPTEQKETEKNGEILLNMMDKPFGLSVKECHRDDFNQNI